MIKVTRLFLIICLICLPCYFSLEKPKATRNVEITADDEKLRDPAGFEAIKEIHKLMDDDQSGSIDRYESNDFLQEDMKLTGSDRARRERAFHHDDDAITVDDMWESWFESEERNWDEQAIAAWLTKIVKLPQYEKTFLEHKVTGIALPRMALQNSSFLTNYLGIKNFVHRQKLQLKALDLVLFGFQEPSNSKLKDIILGVLTLVCIILGYVLTKFHIKSKQQVEELTSKLSEIKSMESEFEKQQKRFSVDEDAESVVALKSKLEEAEKRLEMTGGESFSYSIQPLLRKTYEMEISCINEKKIECLHEMKEAKEFVDRMRGKQNLLNTLKLVAGATALGTDVVDAKVFSLKQRMEKLKAQMDECQQRWIEIENICGFSITGPYRTHPGTVPVSVSSSKLSVTSRKQSQVPSHIVPPTFYVSPSLAGSDTPPSTITSQTAASVKSDVSTVRTRLANQISDDTNSLTSHKSSASIGQKLNSIFKKKAKA
uniref:SAM domain-containing protein n=1 Tax=Panagrolaimus sp. JU765 TaxID=591449 RepID=A0AC34REP2_9BILA